MKKLYYISAIVIMLFSLSFCASSLYIKDSAVTYEEVQVGSDAVIVEPEEKTLPKTENLKVTKSAVGAVTLSWDKIDEAYAYQVYIKYEGDDDYRYTYTVRSNEVTVENIDSEDALRFRVRAFCYDSGKVVYGEYSDSVKAVTKPSDVENIYTRSITDNSITLYWDKPKGATNYRVYIYDAEKEKFRLYKRTSRTTMTVSSLEKDTRYIFKIMSYKKIDDSVAFGDYSREYTEFTYNSGSVPHTMAQTAQHYNEMIASLKAQPDMTVKYKKTIDTEFVSCSKKNLAMSVKNTLSLFEGTLKKNYKYVGGTNEDKSANKLIEPYGKKASLEKNDIEKYEISKKDGKYVITITLKDESKLYKKGDSKQKSYFDGAIALPEFKKLKTSPLVIEGADSYYDGGTLTMTVSDGKVEKLSIKAAMLADIDFSVAEVTASTIAAYEMTETYNIIYADEDNS
ncbi:MAG: fibronectin type III domain-containing protein [Clostridia bacterium]|nr:fibronectin type III domain-containing protein [Clostridia bacterium]